MNSVYDNASPSPASLKKFLVMNKKNICQVINEKISQGENVSVLITGAVAGHNKSKALAVCKCVVKNINHGRLSGPCANSCVSTLIDEVGNLPGSMIARLSYEIIDGLTLENNIGKAFEILPKILICLHSQSKIDLSAVGEDNVDGAGFLDRIVHKLCQTRWSSSVVLGVLSALVDLNLEDSHYAQIVKKLISNDMSYFRALDTNQYPALVYQLVRLATKTQENSCMILSSLLSFFASEEKALRQNNSQRERKEFLSAEGTALIHFNFAAKQDQRIVKEILREVQNHIIKLSPFALCVLLSFARIRRFEKRIFSFLKTYCFHWYEQAYQTKTSECVKLIMEDNLLLENAEESMIQALHNSDNGWSDLAPSFVQFGNSLLEYERDLDSLKNFDDSDLTVHSAGVLENPTGRVGLLGVHILVETFKMHKASRGSILDLVLHQIVTCRDGGYLHAIVLQRLMLEKTYAFYELVPKLKNSMDFVPFLPHQKCEVFLQALVPLMRINPELQDHVMLVLRKAMFSRDSETRLCSLSGFTSILQPEVQQGAFSSSQSSRGAQNNADVFRWNLEIICILRRALKQQYGVRKELYKKLYWIYSSHKSLRVHISEILVSHFVRFQTSAESSFPLSLKICFDRDQTVLEPVADLMWAIMKCVVLDKTEGAELAPCQAKSKELILNVVNRISKCGFIDFNLAEEVSSSQEKIQMFSNVEIMIQLLESCMGFSLVADGILEDRHGHFCSFSNLLTQVLDYVRENAGAGDLKYWKTPHHLESIMALKVTAAFARKTKKRSRTTRDTRGMSLSDVIRITEALRNDASSQGMEVQQNARIWEFIFSSCLERLRCCLQRRSSLSELALQNQMPGKKELKKLCSLLLDEINRSIHTEAPDSMVDEDVDNDSVLNLLLSSLRTACLLSSWNPKLKLVSEVHNVVLFDEPQLNALRVVFNSLLIKNKLKEAGTLIDILDLVSGKAGDHDDWVEDILKAQNIADTILAKKIVHHHLNRSDSMLLLMDLACNLVLFFGENMQEYEPTQIPELAYKIINDETAGDVALMLIQNLECIFQKIDWVFSQTSALQVARVSEEDEYGQNAVIQTRNKIEDNAFFRLNNLFRILGKLTDAKFDDSSGESLMKVLTHAFKTISNCIKKMTGSKRTPSKKMKSAVKSACQDMTGPVYLLINSLQNRVADDESKTKIRREKSIIPNLIYQIENFEHLVIKYSKSSKVAMDRWLRRTTARDFKIDPKKAARICKENKKADEASPTQTGKSQKSRKRKRPEPQENDSDSGS